MKGKWNGSEIEWDDDTPKEFYYFINADIAEMAIKKGVLKETAKLKMGDGTEAIIYNKIWAVIHEIRKRSQYS